MDNIVMVTVDASSIYQNQREAIKTDLRETKKSHKGQVIKKITPLALFLCTAYIRLLFFM